MKRLFFSLLCILIVSPAFAEGDAASGKKLFKRCAACHAVEAGKNKVGPSLFDIYGRNSASVEGYKYSKSFQDAGLTWDDESLDSFLASPKKFIPGNKMGFAGLKKEKQRADIIAYLKSLK